MSKINEAIKDNKVDEEKLLLPLTMFFVGLFIGIAISACARIIF